MPKRKRAVTPQEQSEHFKREAQKLIDAGELNPTGATDRLDRLVKASRTAKVDD